MKATIQAGTKAWFEVRFNGTDAAIFNQDTQVQLEYHSAWWYKTKGQIHGFPAGHPCILINTVWLPKTALENTLRLNADLSHRLLGIATETLARGGQHVR